MNINDKIGEGSFIELSLDGIKQGTSGKTSWVYAIPANQDIWNGKRLIKFDNEDLALLQSEFIKINHEFTSLANGADTSPYRFPVKINHTRGSGDSMGNLLDVKVMKGKPNIKDGLYLSVEWNDTTWGEIQKGNYKYVSVGIKPEYTTQLGTTFGPIIVELSLTEYPRVQTIGTIQDTLDLQLANKINTEDIDMEEVKAMIMEMMAAMKEEIMAELKPEEAPEETPDEEMAEDVAPDAEMEEVPAEDAPKEDEEMASVTPEAIMPEAGVPDAKPEEDKDEVEKLKAELADMKKEYDDLKKSASLSNDVKSMVRDAMIELSNENVDLSSKEIGKAGEPKTIKLSWDQHFHKLVSEGIPSAKAYVLANKLVK